MRAISLWQPHAQAVALGIKEWETRHWSTNYRGPLAICSTVKPFRLKDYEESYFRETWKRLQAAGLNDCGLQYGYLLAVVELTACIRTEALDGELSEDARFWGDFAPGRYAWKLENIERAWPAVRVRGRQNFFNVKEPTHTMRVTRFN